MSNKYIASLICITVLTFAPACKQKIKVEKEREDINTMIELDNSVFEVEREDDSDDTNVVKF